MKRVVFILILLLIWTLPARAGQESSAKQLPEQARQRLEQIKERLALTPEQIEQVRPILAEEAQKLKALREQRAGGGRRELRKMGRELRDIQSDADKRLEKVLSKEQMKELKRIREESRQQMRERARQRQQA